MPRPAYPSESATTRFATTAVVFALALSVWGCSSTSGPGEVVVPVPTVSGLDKTSVVPGDTVTVTGKDFHSTLGYNRVRFNNPLADAVPFDGSTTMLRVVVPVNAASGPVMVIVPNQPKAGVGPDVEVTRGVGDVWVLGGAGHVDLPTPNNAEYLLVPYAGSPSSPTTQEHGYTVTAAGMPPAASASAREASDVASPLWTANDAFESRRWEHTDDLLERAGAPTRTERRMDAAPARAPQLKSFNVYSNIEGSLLDPASYTTVSAELRLEGQHCLIYTDLDTLSSGNLSWTDIQNFADTFDNKIHPSNTTYFGTESDVDHNGKVIILISRVVNHLTPANSGSFIGGFFLPIDLYEVGGGIPSGTTNQAEIFYVLAADTDWDSRFTASFVAAEDLRTIVHEYQHLISFSYRLFHFGPSAAQSTWLEEGMAHMAEDLLAQETGDASFNASNVGRANRYLGNPGSVSLEWDASPVEQRGGIYLFLRLLGDRFDNGIYKQILQNSCVGRPCIEKVSGESFYNTVGEFLSALYLSGRGITTDPRYNYKSIDLGSFQSVSVSTWNIDGVDHNDSARRAAGDLYRFVNPTAGTARVTLFTASSTMGLRTVIVRTK